MATTTISGGDTTILCCGDGDIMKKLSYLGKYEFFISMRWEKENPLVIGGTILPWNAWMWCPRKSNILGNDNSTYARHDIHWGNLGLPCGLLYTKCTLRIFKEYRFWIKEVIPFLSVIALVDGIDKRGIKFHSSTGSKN